MDSSSQQQKGRLQSLPRDTLWGLPSLASRAPSLHREDYSPEGWGVVSWATSLLKAVGEKRGPRCPGTQAREVKQSSGVPHLLHPWQLVVSWQTGRPALLHPCSQPPANTWRAPRSSTYRCCTLILSCAVNAFVLPSSQLRKQR